MKKIRKIRVIGMMFCLGLLILTSGCSEQYKMERLVWHADQDAKSIFINEGAVPSYEFNRVLEMYKKIIKVKPDSKYALDAKFKITKLYLSEKNYDQARFEYDAIMNEYKDNAELVSGTLFLKGQSYEQEKKWPEALKLFNQIIAQYDKTSQALSVPMYIARYYMAEEDTVEAVKAYKTAIDYYQNIADKYPHSKASLLCENLIVRVYMEMSSWDDALEYIQKLDSKYKLGPETLMFMAQIYKEKVKDMAKARAVYQRILDEYPEHKVADYVRQLMEQEKK